MWVTDTCKVCIRRSDWEQGQDLVLPAKVKTCKVKRDTA